MNDWDPAERETILPMTKPRSSPWRLVTRALPYVVTIAAVVYVFSQITWQDRLLSASGGAGQWGWLVRDQGMDYFAPLEGDRIPLNAETKKDLFIPGFVTLLRGLNVWLFAAVILVFPLQYLIAARRWQWLLQTHDLDPGFIEALRLTWIGILMNTVLPSSTGGDLVKGWSIYRRTPGKRVPAVMTVLFDRVMGLISLLLIGTIAAMFQPPIPGIAATSRFVSGTLLFIIIGALVFFSGRIRRALRIDDLLSRIPMGKAIKRLDDSLFHYRAYPVVLAKCVAISFLVHFWTIVSVYFISQALGLNAPFSSFLIFLPIIFTGGALLPSIAGLGVIEGLFQQFFALVGMSASSSVALCVLYRVMMLVGAIPGAIPTFQEFSTNGVPILSETTDEFLEEAEESDAATDLSAAS